MLAEHDGSTGNVLVDYINGSGGFIAKINSGGTFYFVGDRISDRLRLDGSGNITGQKGHLPFGEDFAESGAQEKHHFTSYERDAETGLDYAVNRIYPAAVGRFHRPDPYGQSQRLAEPQSLNRYTYAGNDPINQTDPLGLDPLISVTPSQTLIGFLIGFFWNSISAPGIGPPQRHDPLQDTGDGTDGSDPGDLAPFKCEMEFNTIQGAPAVGKYPVGERIPNVYDPSNTPIGAGTDGTFWYYFFEGVAVSTGSTTPLMWVTATKDVTGTKTLQLPGGGYETSPITPQHGADTPDFFHNVDTSLAGFLIWLDSPAERMTDFDKAGNLDKVVGADISWKLTFQVSNGLGVSSLVGCQGGLTLHLKFKPGQDAATGWSIDGVWYK
ncbi:MAG TPA: RHS repeat-associated core domain-containing protein [Blastocatellia bacterium]|nr:RHS repeat-associated core domain-containing protein [Blastocatellia bacterium]